jgi:hypothetical protein
MSEATDLLARIARLQEQIAQNQAELLTAQQEFRDRLVARLEFTISQQQQQLAEVQRQLTQVQQQDALGTASAGAVVTTAQTAKDDGANTQEPQAPAGRIVRAADVNQNLEAGTNEPVKKLEQTQATPPANPNSSQPVAGQDPGAVGRPDDNPGANKNTTQQAVNANFSQRITPKDNVLDLFASYAYSITWYLLTPEQYNQAQTQQRKNVTNWSILVQSGGAPITVESTNQGGRNQFFNVDYYIDNLSIEHNYSGKGSGGATNNSSITFQITEPNGITFIPNLASAVTTLYKTMSPPMEGVWTQAQYCLAIRFYGYDEAGNLVKVGRSGALGANNASDPKAGVEKYIFFNISKLTTKIHSKQIVYDVEAVPTTHGTGLSQNRGTIPYAYQLTGITVGEVLGGKAFKASTATTGRVDSGTDAPAQPPVITGEANQDVGGGTTFSLGVAA